MKADLPAMSSKRDNTDELTPSQTRKRRAIDIQTALELYEEAEFENVEKVEIPETRRPKLTQAESESSSALSETKTHSTIPEDRKKEVNSHSNATKDDPKTETCQTASHPSSPTNSDIGQTNISTTSAINDESTSVDNFLDETVDMEAASSYLSTIACTSGVPFQTKFPPLIPKATDAIQPAAQPSSATTASSSKAPNSAPPYKVTRVHHAKFASEFARLKSALENSLEMVVISYNTNGDVAKEFSSTRGSKDMPKGVLVPPTNLKEQIQMVAMRIDDQNEVFEMEIAPQTSNAFAMMAGGAQKTSSAAVVQPHLDLLVSIIHRTIVPPTHIVSVYNTQRLLRLIQMAQQRPQQTQPIPPKKSDSASNSSSNADNKRNTSGEPSSETKNSSIQFYPFQEPPFDPFVAGFVINPEMGVEMDAERTALSMRAYEYTTMIATFCPPLALSVLKSRPKNVLADDTYYTRDLVLALSTKLQEDELLDAFMFEMRIAVILARMETPGMRVDLNYLEEPRRAISAKLKELTSMASTILGHDILLSSHSQVADAIYPGLEAYLSSQKLSKKSALRPTDTKKHLSTRESALQELRKMMRKDGKESWKQYKIIEIVLEHRPIHKLLSFLEAVETSAEPSKDPRFRVVYPKWLQCNTGTGRITCSSPNMQTQPTIDEIRVLAQETEREDGSGASSHPSMLSSRIGSSLDSMVNAQNSKRAADQDSASNNSSVSSFEINIRSAYVSRPGYTLVGADYSQIEMRIVAQASNDEALVQYFSSGMDIHRQVAAKVFNLPLDQVTSQQREWCKRIVYGIIYGMGVQALSKSLDITSARGQEFYESFMGSFPKVRQWIAHARGHISGSLTTRTMLGRIRRFQPGTHSDAGKYLRQGVNTAIQGSAADIVKLAMVKIETEVYESEISANLLLQIHDELIYEVKDEHVETFKVILKRCMEGAAPHFDVPLTINIETGTSWGLMKP